jgi:hypothetical protein
MRRLRQRAAARIGQSFSALSDDFGRPLPVSGLEKQFSLSLPATGDKAA